MALTGLRKIDVHREEHGYPANTTEPRLNHITGRFYHCDVQRILPLMLDKYENKIQLIYMDPPFMTGQTYRFQQPVGIEGWRGNRKHVVDHIAYNDTGKTGKDYFLSMMRRVITYAYHLLSPEGSLYLHVDYRTSAYLRIILDEVFGEDNMLNEIIWHYQSGGRAKKHFSRKHDTILFYRKSSRHYFNPEAVGIPRGKSRRNHMKQGVDQDGRIFWSIRSGGKEYRYFEDSKVYPSDVWSDISHLHQRDPERRGYDTQKPEALLERIILASSRPGDLAADFFAGSGTTLAVAQKLGRNWIGIDNGVFSLHTCRKRLVEDIYNGDYDLMRSIKLVFSHYKPLEKPGSLRPEYEGNVLFSTRTERQKPCCADSDRDIKNDAAQEIEIDLKCIRLADGQVEIGLYRYDIPKRPDRLLKAGNDPYNSLKNLNLSCLDLVDYWAAGYIKENAFKALGCSMRTVRSPYIKDRLRIGLKPGYAPAVHIVDVLGQQWFFLLEAGK